MKRKELRSETMLLLKQGRCFRGDAPRICNRARIPLHPMFETDQFSRICPVRAAGLGITLVREMAASTADGCVLLPLEREALRRVGDMRVRRHAAGAGGR